MDRVAELVSTMRDERFIEKLPNGKSVNATSSIFYLGGATLDNEFNHIAQKFCRGFGIVLIEHQARICHSSSVRGLGARLGQGAATMFPRDMSHSDCIVIMGSHMAECHPVAFRWLLKARMNGAKLIHVDPRGARLAARRGGGASAASRDVRALPRLSQDRDDLRRARDARAAARGHCDHSARPRRTGSRLRCTRAILVR